MLLYPTETIYALGVNVLDSDAMQLLYTTKGRVPDKPVSLLVRNSEDIIPYASMNAIAEQIIEAFLPGPLTLVLPAKSTTPAYLQHNGMVSFRISPDPVAQAVIADFMATHHAPLTCTSANRSGFAPETTPDAIQAQLGALATNITKVYDDGPRNGTPSTVVAVADTTWHIIRSGEISTSDISRILDK